MKEGSNKKIERWFSWPVLVNTEHTTTEDEERDRRATVREETTAPNRAVAKEYEYARREAGREPLFGELRTPIGAEIGIHGDTTTVQGAL